jgi:hypothetical protein
MNHEYMEFGPRNHPYLIPHPLTGPSISRVGYTAAATGLNGGAEVRRSSSAHGEFNYSWNAKRMSELQPLIDCYSGIRGPGPFYFIPTEAADRNVLPAWLAAPMMSGIDGPILDGREVEPDLVGTAANSFEYPIQSATLSIANPAATLSTYIPIPTGTTLHLGAHGSATGAAGARVRAWRRDNGAATTSTLTLLGVNTATLMNASFNSDTYYGVDIDFGTGVGTLTLAGLIGQVLDSGTSPSTGAWMAGLGHSGCEFDGGVSLSQISAVRDQYNASVKLTEVGAWTA